MRAASECVGGVKATTLRDDVRKWTDSYKYGERFIAALAIYKRGPNGPVLSTAWYADFYAAMREAAGVVPDACALMTHPVGVDLVYALRDRRNKCYDADFDEQVRILEGLRMSELRENVLTQAAVPSPDGARIAAKVLENAMPALHASRQQVDVSGKVEHEHGLSPEVLAAGRARLKTLTAGRDREFIDVDAAVVRNTVDAVNE